MLAEQAKQVNGGEDVLVVPRAKRGGNGSSKRGRGGK